MKDTFLYCTQFFNPLSIHTNNSHHRFHAKLSKRTEIRLVTRYDGHLHGDSELDSPRETTRSSLDPCKVKTSWSLSFIHPMQKWIAFLRIIWFNSFPQICNQNILAYYPNFEPRTGFPSWNHSIITGSLQSKDVMITFFYSSNAKMNA